MKNKIYILGILSGVVTVCGCLFKTMHWPVAGIILLVGIVSLSLIFLPLAIVSIIKVENDKRLRIFYILVVIVMAFNFIGVLFKIMQWPGAGKFLMIGIPLPFVVLLPAYLWSNTANKEVNYKNMLAIMFFFAYFAAITSFLAIAPSQRVVESFVTLSDNIKSKTIALQRNTKLISGFSESNNPVKVEADKLCEKITNIKGVILKNKSDASSDEMSFLDSKLMIDQRYLTELKKDINNFRVIVKEEYNSDSRLYKYVEETFRIFDTENWENIWVNKHIVASAVESLNMLEFRIRMIALESYNMK